MYLTPILILDVIKTSARRAASRCLLITSRHPSPIKRWISPQASPMLPYPSKPRRIVIERCPASRGLHGRAVFRRQVGYAFWLISSGILPTQWNRAALRRQLTPTLSLWQARYGFLTVYTHPSAILAGVRDHGALEVLPTNGASAR